MYVFNASIQYFKCWSDHTKHKETTRKLQLLLEIAPNPKRWESTTLTTAPISLTHIVLVERFACAPDSFELSLLEHMAQILALGIELLSGETLLQAKKNSTGRK